MLRTFLDTGVLIAAARSLDPDSERAMEILAEPDRTFLTSPFVHLEVVPKAVFHLKRLEAAFYASYFAAAEWTRDLGEIEALAQTEAAKYGLGAMDALHLAAAYLLRSEEFITTERPGKPVYRCPLVKVVYLFG